VGLRVGDLESSRFSGFGCEALLQDLIESPDSCCLKLLLVFVSYEVKLKIKGRSASEAEGERGLWIKGIVVSTEKVASGVLDSAIGTL